MITRIHAENFKSWKDTGDLRLAPLTGLFGTNSSGKTSILQMLLMMKQTVESTDRRQVLRTGDDRSLVDLGTFSDLIHGHQSDASLRLSFSWKLPKPLVISDPEEQRKELFNIRELSFTVVIREDSNRAVVDSFVYDFDNGKQKFGMDRKNSDKSSQKDQYKLTTGDYSAKRFRGRGWPLPSPVKCYGFPDQAIGYYQNTGFLLDFVLAFQNMFDRMTYLGPLREYPHRSYIWAGERPPDVGRRGEQAIAALLAARAEGRKSGRIIRRSRRYKPIEERILEWMREMRLIQSFSLKPIASNRKDYEFRIKMSETGSEVLITDVGFGVSQILPVLVLCYYAPENSIILLEQPEIHLHPSVQADLADVLIDVVKNRSVQIIVESHSEYLLRRIQRRVAEEVIPSDMAELYFCRMDNSVSKIERLELDMFGNILNWPQDFFGDEMGELVAMTEAEMKRRKESG